MVRVSCRSRLRGRLGRLCDADERGTQQPIMMDVAGLNDAGHRARRILRIGHFEARLVAVRIERLAERFDPLHAMLGEGIEKRASRRLDSAEKRVDDGI
jgi:hypothetical protein